MPVAWHDTHSTPTDRIGGLVTHTCSCNVREKTDHCQMALAVTPMTDIVQGRGRRTQAAEETQCLESLICLSCTGDWWGREVGTAERRTGVLTT